MAKQNTVKEENIVEEVTINQNDVNNTIEDIQKEESVIEENHKEENNIPEEIIVKETIKEEEVKTPIEVKNTSNDKRVRKVIQKRPSHYSLLMEDGRQIVVHKSLFDKKNMVLLSNE